MRRVPYAVQNTCIDTDGRYVCLTGELDRRQLIIAGIYAPNTGQGEFLRATSAQISQDPSIPIIWGGDFNSVMDISMDRSHPPIASAPSRRVSEMLRSWITERRLRDAWRSLLPIDKEYSFYSPVHNLHTRIDLLLCSATITHSIHSANYLAKTLSEHCPLIATLRWGTQLSRTPSWRLQPALLRDPPFREQLADTIAFYFTINNQTATTRAIEWDGHKVVIRGMCIGAAGGIQHTLLLELHDTEEKLRKAECEAASNSAASNATIQLKKQWGDIETCLRKFDYRHYTARLHTEGDRYSHMLAWLAKGIQRHTPINAIRLDTGVIVNTQSEINDDLSNTMQHYIRLNLPRLQHN
ncbi:hypothetical protein NDU88_004242 [Pleurodeles waltl]|uniref:Endonuclease/exonuclease/phosphatase domain-containing protein n=1 Tax=Pleurodeles waltl TaxID=8319 RepID=A0AAV7VFM5_PLEWA|nr:hypothetical protein NDU88_004242 [Pleurodeles waltl]